MNPGTFHPRYGIALKIAMFSWLVTLVTLLIFVFVIVPQQKASFEEGLASKARGLSASLQDVIAGAAVTEDYSAVVDHCRQVLQGDDSIVYLVISKNDGFSLIQQSTAGPGAQPGGVRPEPLWRQENLDGNWHPALRQASSGIGMVQLFQRRVFHYSSPFDYSGIQWGWVHVGLSLDGYDRSVAAVYRRTGILAVACVIFSLAASILFARRMVTPIRELQTVLQRVAAGDLEAQAAIHSGDEVESLADSFNVMARNLLQRDRTLEEAKATLEQRVRERTAELQEQVAAKEKAWSDLAEAQQRLMDVSRQAGMAEVATGVLHNVGNVLNSVNVSAGLIREKLHSSELTTLVELSHLLTRRGTDLPTFLAEDPVGVQIVPFLAQLAARLTSEHELIEREQALLARNVEHIKEIVTMQQNYARVSGYLEQVSVTTLVDDALRLNAASLERKGIEVERAYAPLPPVMVDKHKVLQILVNLVQNAGQALEAGGKAQRRITVDVSPRGPERLAITVLDNGIGITPENLTRIFSHGFSTRRGGHGFGLHSGALAAREMGGSLSVHSEGAGRGAAFTLELPLLSHRIDSRNAP